MNHRQNPPAISPGFGERFDDVVVPIFRLRSVWPAG